MKFEAVLKRIKTTPEGTEFRGFVEGSPWPVRILIPETYITADKKLQDEATIEIDIPEVAIEVPAVEETVIPKPNGKGKK
jgi:hypothetical protein